MACSPRAPPVLLGVAAAVAMVGAAASLSINGCWGGCGPGFDRIASPLGFTVEHLAPLGLAASALVFAAAWLRQRRAARRGLRFREQRAHPWPVRIALAALLAAILFALHTHSARGGHPAMVDLPSNVGPLVLALAAAGVVTAPFHPGPATNVAVALLFATYPFVVYDPLDSPYWPHRTVVYMVVACALLAASAAAAAVRGSSWALHALAHWRARRTRRTDWLRATSLATAAVALLIAVGASAAVARTASPPYGWYRMYPDCEHEALREIAALAESDPRALVITGSWQAKLVVAAYTTHADRVWFTSGFYSDAAERDGIDALAATQKRHILVVVEPQLFKESEAADTSFLHGSNGTWASAGTWCGGLVELHALSDTPRFRPPATADSWWLEVQVATPLKVQAVTALLDDNERVPLQPTSWGSWAAVHPVPANTTVVFEAQTSQGTFSSPPYAWPRGA